MYYLPQAVEDVLGDVVARGTLLYHSITCGRKTLSEVATSQHVAIFFGKSEKLTANIFDLRPHEWVCLKRAPRNDLNPG